MQLEEQELIQRACQESFLAAGSTGSSGGSSSTARLPVHSSGGGSSSTARPRYSRSNWTPINYSDDTRSVDYISTR
jgi:hypothetical protein